MNQLLLKHKDPKLSVEEFKKSWENLGYSLEPLYKAIQELTPKDRVTKEELNSPSLMEKLVWYQAQRDFSERILDLFPKSLDK